MARDVVFERAASTQTLRPDHPQRLLEQISDAFYDSADAVAQLRDRLVQLAEQLESRFAEEEHSGRLDDVLCHAPWLTPKAQELQQQHVPLVETVRGIQRMCDADDNPVAWWGRVRREFEGLAERLQEHEAGDNRLLQDTHVGPAWANEE